MKFLIDECLTPELARQAQEAGFEAAAVKWLGLGGTKDWDLIAIIEEGDWTFVTRNSADFRGSATRPGRSGQYTRMSYHAGLICINGPVEMDRSMQKIYFGIALNVLPGDLDLTNRVIEVTHDPHHPGAPLVSRYELPSVGSAVVQAHIS